MQQYLAKHCSENQTDWDEHLMLPIAYHSAVCEATGYTPVQMMCGRMRLAMDLAMGRPLGEEELPEHSPAFVRELRRRMKEVHWFARQKLKLAGEVMRRWHDQGARYVSFQIG